MAGLKNIVEYDSVMAPDQPGDIRLRICAVALVAVAIVSSAFHFRPFDNSKLWQMFNPSNTAVLAWSVLLTASVLLKRRCLSDVPLPHASVFAYLTVSILSLGFAPDPTRAANFIIKSTLILVGGYTLIASAVYNEKSLRRIYTLTIIAVTMSIGSCLLARFALAREDFGFAADVYKYGTYIGTLAPLCAAYLFAGPDPTQKILAAVLIITALVSAGSLGTAAAVASGSVTLAIILLRRRAKIYPIAALACGVGLLVALGANPALEHLKNDVSLTEKDRTNLKQRYIEAQAEINLLEKRTITGTGAGCINEYRSNFYYRLPKLNTLKPFDQNGWLATTAETGLFGLVCFCWIVVHHARLAFAQLRTARKNASAPLCRLAAANFVGLIAACVANLFSSVHYNGILIVFILIIALISRTNLLYGQDQNENTQIR